MTDDKIADDIIATLEKLRAENPGDFMAVAEMRNEVLEEAARVADEIARADAGVYKKSWSTRALIMSRTGRDTASTIAERIRSLKSGGKNA